MRTCVRRIFVSIRSSALSEIGECIRPINLDFFIRSAFPMLQDDLVITPSIADGLRGRAESCYRDDAWGTNREWHLIFQAL